jgi:hypothetical protein
MPRGVYLRSKSQNIKIGLTLKRKGIKPPLRSGFIPWNKGLSINRGKKKPFGFRIGMKHSEIAKENMRKAALQRVKNGTHNWWKGGITPLIRLVRVGFHYRRWRSDIFTRDNFTCQLCGKRGGRLEADHYPKAFAVIFYENHIVSFVEAILCEELWNINNGRTLCKDCHLKTPTHGRGVNKRIRKTI